MENNDKNDLVLIFFDLETTGLNPDLDEVIEIGAIKVKDGEVIEHFHSFVRPHRNIPSLVTNLTGITFKDVENAPDPEVTKEKLERFLGKYPLIAHNVSFDRIFLEKFMGKRLENEFFDTLELARIFFPDLPSHSLQNLVKSLSLKKEEAHRALSDTMMLYALFDKISFEVERASPFLLHRVKDISKPVRNFEKIFGKGWEKPLDKEGEFSWKSKGVSGSQTLPFETSEPETHEVEKLLSGGTVYAQKFSDDEILHWITDYAISHKIVVSLYNADTKENLVSLAKKKGLTVFCLNNFNRFVCPKKIERLISHPELITDNLKMNFATLFAYLYKTRDFLLKNAPTHILRNPLLRLLSFCEGWEQCEYKDVCPFAHALKETKSCDILVANHPFFFSPSSESFDFSERTLFFTNSYRLVKSFYSAKVGFSVNDFMFFANYHELGDSEKERIKEVFRALEEKSIGEDVKWASDELKSIFSGKSNLLLEHFLSKEHFWMERRGDSPVVFSANKSSKSEFALIKSKVEDVLFFTPRLGAADVKNVLENFTGIKGEIKVYDKELNGKFLSVVPLFMHSPNREEFVEEYVSFFEKIHTKNKNAIMLFSSSETMKRVYFLLKRKGFDAKARGIDLKTEHGEIELTPYDASFSGKYDEIFFVRLPTIVPSFYGKSKSQTLLYSVYLLKNIATELLFGNKKVEIYYFDGRFKTPSFRSRFDNDFVSFPLFADREQALLSMLLNWRRRNS